MKNNRTVFSCMAIVSAVALLFSGCRKINEATELGGGLIPPVDNITTFETYLDIESDNKPYSDTNKVYYADNLALGYMNDPEFGTTSANLYFNVAHGYNGLTSKVNPFYNKDSVMAIDSVVLSLSYKGYYGDSNAVQTVRVFEIAQGSGFNDTTGYRYDHADFLTTGGELGSKTFQVKSLDDTILHIRKRDTTKLVNVLRIPLTNQLGNRFKLYDTTLSANGGYYSDSLFFTLFRGLAVKADNTGNALTYISPSDNSNTQLTVYFQVKRNGVIDTTSFSFTHSTGGNANVINRIPAGGWNTYLTNATTNDDLIYLQSVPGSFASLRIPALDTFRNVVVHRAELIATPIRSTGDNFFTQPLVLFLDKVNAAGDTVSTFDLDMGVTDNYSNFTYDAASFGGALKTDSTYRFNISRYVQNMVTKRTSNPKMRLYAPLRTFVYSPTYNLINQIYVSSNPAYGRVVLAGGNYVNPSKRIRLRLVYSKL